VLYFNTQSDRFDEFMQKIRNQKHEIRNNFQTQSPNIQMDTGYSNLIALSSTVPIPLLDDRHPIAVWAKEVYGEFLPVAMAWHILPAIDRRLRKRTRQGRRVGVRQITVTPASGQSNRLVPSTPQRHQPAAD
jgi:hypothetical protein